VGALNPSGQSVATFSNSGPWVTCHRPGVHVVSTLPTTLQASAGADLALVVDGHPRSSVDADDHRGGFGVWSGTSFAAPALAGALAARLHREDDEATDVSPGGLAARAWTALGDELGWSR
jgi:subtilisin family serine protease